MNYKKKYIAFQENDEGNDTILPAIKAVVQSKKLVLRYTITFYIW